MPGLSKGRGMRLSSRLAPQCPWENDSMPIQIPTTHAKHRLKDARGGEQEAPRPRDYGILGTARTTGQ